VAEGGSHREAAEVGRGNYPVTDINATVPDNKLADQDGQANGDPLPSPRPGDVGYDFPDYDFSLDYLGYFLPPPGYSVVHFSRYDYDVDSFGDPAGSRIHVRSRYFKIGPKAE
jgi:hypothetical protein